MEQERFPATRRTHRNETSPVQEPVSKPDIKIKQKVRFRIPVGVALGFVFSALLVVICGTIVAYMAASNRGIARQLLDEKAAAILNGNQLVLEKFFSGQDLLLRSIAAKIRLDQKSFGKEDFSEYAQLLPENAGFELSQDVMGNAPTDGIPEIVWSDFEWRESHGSAAKSAEIDLGNGQKLIARYPRSVFSGLAKEMTLDERQTVFMLSGRDRVITVNGLSSAEINATPATPLPALETLVGTPLHQMWSSGGVAHEMGGRVSGRLFPSAGRMYTAIFSETGSGPAKGWKVGVLYQAHQFGAALDQTRFVLYAALAALIAGATLSFFMGRILGRPLTRLAEIASDLRKLDFNAGHRLPASNLAELNDVNLAFNGSIGALNAFAKYVPRELVARLVDAGMTESRNIEVREMTIVFTDLADFTNLASHLTAEETAEYLNGYFETVSRAIAACDGTIDKFLGDGVMAFWGAPSDQPDHAAKAIAAVTALAEQIEMNPSWKMRLRIGIHTGKVVVGDIGSASRMNYTVIGDAVNVAARLQEYGKQIAPEARVIALASGDTMAQLPEGSTATSLGRVKLRGRDEPLTVFRIA